jgi:hypothetical protein
MTAKWKTNKRREGPGLPGEEEEAGGETKARGRKGWDPSLGGRKREE